MIARGIGGGDFASLDVVRSEDHTTLELDHCIHLPCVVDWDGDGNLDILVGSEDGYITFLRNTGDTVDGLPRFEKVGRVETQAPIIHASVLPSLQPPTISAAMAAPILSSAIVRVNCCFIPMRAPPRIQR